MYKTKLIKLLRTLDEMELEAFIHYVNSPLFNKNKRCIQLLALLAKAAPDYTTTSISQEQIFEQMFEGKGAISSLRVATSLLTNLLKDFLTFQHSRKDTFYQNQMLLEALKERGLPELVKKNLERITKDHIIRHETSTNYYLQDYMLQEFTITFKKGLVEYRRSQDDLDYTPVLEIFYTYTLLNKLKCWSVILNDCLSMGWEVKYNKKLLQHTIKEAELYDLNTKPITQLWYLLVLLLNTNDNQYFDTLKNLLGQENSVFIPKEYLAQLYTIMFNYCNRRVVTGDSNYYAEMFTLYTQMITKKLLHLGDYIPARHIKNIVTVGLRSKNFAQTQEFIEAYKTEVAPNIRENAYHFHMGAFFFYQQDYNQALRHLIEVGKIDIYYDLDAQALLLKSYYELKDSHALLAFIGSYKNFVKNNKQLPKKRQQVYINFINLTMNLFRIKALYGKKSPIELKSKIQSTKQISDKAWLLAKVGELIE